MLTGSLQACGIRTLGICAVAAFDNGDKVVYQFLWQCFAIGVGIHVIGCRISVVITR